MARRVKILIIDDEEAFCEFVKETLEMTGRYRLLIANAGAVGIEMAQKHRPSLILLDINMPEMSGAAVAERLLHAPSTRDIPIAFITGLVTKEAVEKRDGYIHGFLFITKPVTTRELVAQVESVFEIIEKQKALLGSLEK